LRYIPHSTFLHANSVNNSLSYAVKKSKSDVQTAPTFGHVCRTNASQILSSNVSFQRTGREDVADRSRPRYWAMKKDFKSSNLGLVFDFNSLIWLASVCHGW